MSVVTRWEPGPMPFHLLADSEATGGHFLVGEARLDPGAPCPGLHVHTHEYESFYIIEGVLTVELGGERFELKDGDYLKMPPNVPHRFANLSDGPVRLVGAMAPTGIEKMFAEEAEYFATLDGPYPPDMERVAEITAAYGVKILGGPLTK